MTCTKAAKPEEEKFAIIINFRISDESQEFFDKLDLNFFLKLDENILNFLQDAFLIINHVVDDGSLI